MTFYTIDRSSIRYKNQDEARKAIIDRGAAGPQNRQGFYPLGAIYNELGIKCGTIFWDADYIIGQHEFLLDDPRTGHVWPINDDGSIFKDPYQIHILRGEEGAATVILCM